MEYPSTIPDSPDSMTSFYKVATKKTTARPGARCLSTPVMQLPVHQCLPTSYGAHRYHRIDFTALYNNTYILSVTSCKRRPTDPVA